jgi:hypothetical protein
MLILALLFYISALMMLVAFFAGAARLNQKWDQAQDHQLHRRLRSRKAA